MEKVTLITTRYNPILDSLSYASIESSNLEKQFICAASGGILKFFIDQLSSGTIRVISQGTESPLVNALATLSIEDINQKPIPLAGKAISILHERQIRFIDDDYSELAQAVKGSINSSSLGLYESGKLLGNICRINNTNIFITNEWPKFIRSENCNKINYLEAVVADICRELKQSVLDFDWNLILHDVDMGWVDTAANQAGLTSGLIKFETLKDKYLPHIRENLLLKKIFKNDNSKIWLFQHTSEDNIYRDLIEKLHYDPQLLLNKQLANPSLEHRSKSSEMLSNANIVLMKIEQSHKNNKDVFWERIYNFFLNDAAFTPIILRGNCSLDDLKTSFRDQRLDFFDSSIWIRYAGNDVEQKELVETMERYEALSLYQSRNAKEVVEFKCRMAKESKLKDFGDHAEHVTPFIFHSETKMKTMASEQLNEISSFFSDRSPNAAKRAVWRILVLDDRAALDNEEEGVVAKCKILHSILKDDFTIIYDDSENIDEIKWACFDESILKIPKSIFSLEKIPSSAKPVVLFIDYALSIKEANEKLASSQYDLVLLDYLLGHVISHSGESVFKKDKYFYRENGIAVKEEVRREYSDELLKNIYDNAQESAQFKRLNGKYWFFFISAFTYAISEKMLSRGLQYNTHDWLIARGACPTTTPELFKYNFYSYLLRQLKLLTSFDIKESDQRIISFLDLFKYIFGNSEMVRKRAVDNFDSFLTLKSHYSTLSKEYNVKDKKRNGSLLVQTLFPDIEFYDNQFWAHMQHLLYLIAFGNIGQWNAMWDDFMCVKKNLQEAEEKTNMKVEVTRMIGKYIVSLRDYNL